MPLIHRISDLLSAQFNDLLERCEDPEKMLKQAIRDIEQAVEIARDRAVTVIANERLVAQQRQQHLQQIDRQQRRADDAVAAGDDESARHFLTLMIHHRKQASILHEQHARLETTARRLRRQLDTLRTRLAEARHRQASTIALLRAAEAQRKMHSAGSTDPDRIFSKVDLWFDQLKAAEVEAEVWCELASADRESDLEHSEHLQVEQELAALKKKGT